MLQRSFKSSKCKTALNLAKSRIKLLKNRKEIQVQQLKRELAHLLQSGRNQTARIRVEHVVREEKMMAAYELIDIYCELIVVRLPIIESQKNCPLDLKEAISSLIFAAPRCGDIPELQDVLKLFTAKYGKDFVAAAVELRPACGVSRIMVEKLSLKPPDGPTKVKILTAIAQEHNIEWEPKWFKDEAEMPHIDSPRPVQHTERVNAIQMHPLNFEIADVPPQQFAREEASSLTSSQIHVNVDADFSAVPHSASSHDHTRVGSASERATSSQPFATGEKVTSQQNRNMESKDATIYLGREGSSVYPDNLSQQEFVEKNHPNNSSNHMSSRMSVGVHHDENEQGNLKEGSEAITLKDHQTQHGIEVETSSDPVHDTRKSNDSLFSSSQDESNIFQSSHQEYHDEPYENPFYVNSVQNENRPSNFQPQYPAFDDEYNIFSQQNNPSKKDHNDGSLFDFHQGTTTYDDWHVVDAHHFNETDVEQMGTDTSAVFDESGSNDDDDDEYNIIHVWESYDRPSPSKPVPKHFLSHEINPPENLHYQSSCSCYESSSNEKAPSRESSIKKLGHVHPKLPDFESVTAHLQSLHTNRR